MQRLGRTRPEEIVQHYGATGGDSCDVPVAKKAIREGQLWQATTSQWAKPPKVADIDVEPRIPGGIM